MNIELKVAAWNVRGMCNKEMQKDVKKFISSEGLHICALLETHVKEKQIGKVCDFVFGNWNWCSNLRESDRGCRIIVGWNEDHVNIMQLHSSKQTILCVIDIKDSKNKFYCCFVYAANTGRERKDLWKTLASYKSIINDSPWSLWVTGM